MTRKTFLTLILLLLSGCAPASPSPGAESATQTQPPPEAPSATPQPAETQSANPSVEAQNVITFDKLGIIVGFDFPEGYSQPTLTGTADAYQPNAPFELAYPARAYILFDATSGGDMNAGGFRIFRVDEVNALEAGVVENLFAALDGQADHHNDFPRLAGAGNIIDAQLSLLDFQNGSGYRFLLTKSFSADPIQSTSMTYMYQGVTADEKYFLSFIIGVDAPFLAPYVNQPLTSGEEFETYFQTVNNLVDTSPAGQFAPSLAVLDELVSSIIVIEK